MDGTDYISANEALTIDGLFRKRVENTPDKAACTYFDKQNKEWKSHSWADMAQKVGQWQAALQIRDIEAGDRLAILMKNGPDWVMVDQASMGVGMVAVPLYLDDRPDNIAYIIQDSGARILAVQTALIWKRLVESTPNALKGVEHVIIFEGDIPDNQTNLKDTTLWTEESWLAINQGSCELFKRNNKEIHDLATIVYTSGTTGKPKGVMLSHNNLLSIAEGAGIAMKVHGGQRLLSFLPLSHTFERSCGYYTPLMWGMEIAYARSVQQLANDMLAIKPQVLIAVPRIFERIYDGIQSQLAKKSFLSRSIYKLAVYVGWRNFLTQQKRGRRGLSHILWPFLRTKVANPLLAKLGGQIDFAVSGGAALPPEVAKVFLSMGLNLIQGYGMTESSPVVAANRADANDPNSVGQALRNIEVRIGKNDELQVKGPGVMLGYWNNHKATSEVIMDGHWLRTGDKAKIENDLIYITGRLKDILIMSNGEKIPPVDMEDAIALDPVFDNALIVGEGKAYLGALVILNSEQWIKLAEQYNLDPLDESALQSAKLNKMLVQRVSKRLNQFPGYAKVRRVSASLNPWTVENGLLTPTLKTKRQVVIKQFESDINTMFENK